jgi:hypothetical protein
MQGGIEVGHGALPASVLINAYRRGVVAATLLEPVSIKSKQSPDSGFDVNRFPLRLKTPLVANSSCPGLYWLVPGIHVFKKSAAESKRRGWPEQVWP